MIQTYHCTKCHHEWETVGTADEGSKTTCDWCGARGYIIDERPMFPFFNLAGKLVHELRSKRQH